MTGFVPCHGVRPPIDDLVAVIRWRLLGAPSSSPRLPERCPCTKPPPAGDSRDTLASTSRDGVVVVAILPAVARGSAQAVRTTVYRITGFSALKQVIRSKYLETGHFTTYDVQVGERRAVLVVGAMITDKAKWAPRVEQLTGVNIEAHNRTSAGALLIEDEGGYGWALTYGMGFQLLDSEFIDSSFGQRIAVRAANPEDLRSLTRTMIDHRARTDRSSIPSGEQLRSFGIGDFGEIVTRLVGSATIEGLSTGERATIRGADALSIPLGRTEADVLSDLDILGKLTKEAPRPELEVLEQLKPVKDPAVLAMLQHHLRTTLQGAGQGKVGIGWPHEYIDESGTPASHKIYGAGRGQGGPFDDVLTLDRLLDTIAMHRRVDPLEAVSAMKIQLFSDADGDEAISRAIPARKWLAFEADLEGSRYCLHDGRWYQMDRDYASRLQSHVESIFERESSVELPVWTPDLEDEAAYNSFAAAAIGGVLLDRKLIRTVQHREGLSPATWCRVTDCSSMLRVSAGPQRRVTPLDRPSSPWKRCCTTKRLVKLFERKSERQEETPISWPVDRPVSRWAWRGRHRYLRVISFHSHRSHSLALIRSWARREFLSS